MTARIGMLLVVCLGANSWGAEDLRLQIRNHTSNAVEVNVSGGPGLHRLQSRTNLSEGYWSHPDHLSAETNILVGKSEAAQFLRAEGAPNNDVQNFKAALTRLDEGRNTFRYETFGNERFWGDALKLNRAIAGTNHGGVGPGVSPATALAVGLKVDVDALPEPTKQALARGDVDLNAPETTLALLELDAVVGVKGNFNAARELTSVGIQCALCHSTVDNSFTGGIGHRLDGWPNRDLNVGAIVNLSPDVEVLTKALEVDAGRCAPSCNRGVRENSTRS
jgi:hypothetical protein